jgi:transposase InsO family protein
MTLQPSRLRASEAVRCVQGIRLYKESIDNVLTRHGLNVYPRNYKCWSFFKAKASDELWQIDSKGPCVVQGKSYWFLVYIDDYSRFLVLAEQFDYKPRTGEVTALLGRQRRHLKAVLSDHGSQFREQWRRWCRLNGVESHHAHPSYPQDKWKLERCIQSLNREFVNHLREFPGWLKGKLQNKKGVVQTFTFS